MTGVQDDDHNDASTTVTITATGGDYSSVPAAIVAVVVTDDDAPPLPLDERPADPTGVMMECTNQGLRVWWDTPTTGGLPETYEVTVDYDSSAATPITVTYPTTEVEFTLGSGYYIQAYVGATNSEGIGNPAPADPIYLICP